VNSEMGVEVRQSSVLAGDRMISILRKDLGFWNQGSVKSAFVASFDLLTGTRDSIIRVCPDFYYFF